MLIARQCFWMQRSVLNLVPDDPTLIARGGSFPPDSSPSRGESCRRAFRRKRSIKPTSRNGAWAEKRAISKLLGRRKAAWTRPFRSSIVTDLRHRYRRATGAISQEAEAREAGQHHCPGRGRRRRRRLEGLKSRPNSVPRGNQSGEHVGAAVGAAEKGQCSVECRQRIARAKRIIGVDDVGVRRLREFELKLRIGELCRRQSKLTDQRVTVGEKIENRRTTGRDRSAGRIDRRRVNSREAGSAVRCPCRC